MSSSQSASERYGLAPAPGGLALVQDFLNTIAIEGYGLDLLADTSAAQTWVAGAVRAWAAARGTDSRPPALSPADLTRLRALREAIARLIAGEPPSAIGAGSACFVVSGTGEVQWEPKGRGWHWLAAALWGEILLSQRRGTWPRLKRCHNPDCGSTFYDRSKNSSGVWHNVKTCGNAANLRASRARRREATKPPADVS